jgi:hypothetical protein
MMTKVDVTALDRLPETDPPMGWSDMELGARGWRRNALPCLVMTCFTTAS